ncbi:zinc finger protein [Musa troglodytarum]|uniref:Zinc finger protein n=1 Tax=Musa troglodytarum TaxID=320322 RepID=A0A9E7HHY2_9LILI|nr:zinc finger protein [Musa troglodytarum]
MTTRPPRSPDVCHVINRHVSRNTFATVKRCNGTLPIDRSCRRTSVTFHPFFALLFVGERSPITVAKSFVGDVRFEQEVSFGSYSNFAVICLEETSNLP